jgi:hypothetical protein
MLSRACVRGGLRLPGALGSLLAEALGVLEAMRAKKALIRRGGVMSGIDRMLLEVSARAPAAGPAPGAPGDPGAGRRRGAKGALLLCAMAAVPAAVALAL